MTFQTQTYSQADGEGQCGRNCSNNQCDEATGSHCEEFFRSGDTSSGGGCVGIFCFESPMSPLSLHLFLWIKVPHVPQVMGDVSPLLSSQAESESCSGQNTQTGQNSESLAGQKPIPREKTQ